MLTIMSILSEIANHPDFAEVDPLVLHSINEFGNAPIHVLAAWRQPQKLAHLIRLGADINQQGEGGLTPLHIAVEQNDIESTKVLLEAGAELIKDDWGITPLQLAENLKQSEVYKLIYLKAYN